MKKASELDPLAPRPSLDFSKGVRGKHFKRMQEGTNVVLIAPDLLDTYSRIRRRSTRALSLL